MGGLPPLLTKTFNNLYRNPATLRLEFPNGTPMRRSGISTQFGPVGREQFVPNPKAFADTSGWNEFDDGAVTQPVDGTGGSTSILLDRVVDDTKAPTGDTYFQVTKTAVDEQGQGHSIDLTQFSNEMVDQGRPVNVEVKFFTEANFDPTDFEFFIVETSGPTLKNLLTLEGTASVPVRPDGDTIQAQFYPSAGLKNYRLVLMCKTTNLIPYTWGFQVEVFNDEVFQGPSISNARSFTPALEGLGVPTSVNCFFNFVGEYLEVDCRFNVGTPSGVEARVHFPTEADAGPSSIIPGLFHAGHYFRGSTTTEHGGPIWCETGNSYFTFGHEGTFGGSSGDPTTKQSKSGAFTAGQFVSFKARVPRAGRSAGALTSSNALRLQTLKFAGTLSTANHTNNNNWQNVVWNETKDNFNAFSGSTFTAPCPGDYFFAATLVWIANATGVRGIRFDINGGGDQKRTIFIDADAVNGVFAPVSVNRILELDEGDTVTIQGFQNSGGNLAYTTANSFLEIAKLPDFTMFGVQGRRELRKVALTTDTVTVSSDTYVDVAGSSLPLPVGTWDVTYEIMASVKNNSGGQDSIFGNVVVTDASNNEEDDTHAAFGSSNMTDGARIADNITRTKRIEVTTPTTYKLRVRCGDNAAQGTADVHSSANFTSLLTDPDNASVFWARRA